MLLLLFTVINNNNNNHKIKARFLAPSRENNSKNMLLTIGSEWIFSKIILRFPKELTNKYHYLQQQQQQQHNKSIEIKCVCVLPPPPHTHCCTNDFKVKHFKRLKVEIEAKEVTAYERILKKQQPITYIFSRNTGS